MAMSLEEANQKLEKIIAKLDQAIEERDKVNANKALDNITDLNKKADGQLYALAEQNLKNKLISVITEINDGIDQGIDDNELDTLIAIKDKIKSTSEPFTNTKKIIEALQKRGAETQDLIDMQEKKKKTNELEMQVFDNKLKDSIQKKVDIETECIDKINLNKVKEKILTEIKTSKSNWDRLSLDSSLANEKAKARDRINRKLQELQDKGVDVSSLLNWESAPANLDNYINNTNFKKDSQEIAKQYVLDNIKEFPGFVDTTTTPYSVTKTPDEILSAVENKYVKLKYNAQTWQTKYDEKSAENRKINDNIDELKRQESEIAMVEDKTEEEIIEDAMNNDEIYTQAEEIAEETFTGTKNPFKRIRQKAHYYKSYEENNGFVAFCKAVWPFNTYGKLKALATAAESHAIASDHANTAKRKQESGREAFLKSVRKAVAKQMVNGNIDQDKVREKAMEEAINARKEDKGR